jgi:hypothetical protein
MTVQVVVVRGSVVIVTGGERRPGDTRSFSNQHLARPGERILLSGGDAAHLVERGFVKVLS